MVTGVESRAAGGGAFGRLLRQYREAAGLTQEEVAERAGLSREAVSLLERGERRHPYAYTVQQLAEALALSPQDRVVFAEAVRRLGAAAASVPVPAVTSAPPFVGRTRELDLLERHLTGEGPPVLLLAGEPGIGKTRLLQEAARRARAYGWCVLEGGCQRRGGQEPYAPLLGALQSYLRNRDHVHLRTELQGCAWLVRLLPELTHGPIEPLPAWTLSPEQERRLMFGAVGHLLANVAGSAGTLLVLDDLQWAGPDALDLLAALVRSPEVPLRVAGAYRDTEVGPQDPLTVALADLAHARLVVHRTLTLLTPEEAKHLLDGLLEGGAEDDRTGLREQVVQRAGGVPFFLVSCAQALCGGEGANDGPTAVPWDLAQGIRQRVAALPEGAQETLGMAAVVGRRVPRALLVTVAGRPEREVLGALKSACRARLLEEEGEESYQFAHDVIREVVEADLGATGRTMLHRSVADALEQQSGEPPVELLAYHYARSGVQEKAVRYLELAGDRAQAQYANDAAKSYYRQAMDRLRTLGRSLDAAAVGEKLGAVLIASGQYDAALTVLEQAVEMYSAAGDPERLGYTLAQLGHTLNMRGTPEESVARLQPLAVRLEASGAVRGLAVVHAALAESLSTTSRYREALTAAEQAAELARAVGDNKLLATAEQRRAWALLLIGGHREEALQVLEQARRLAEVARDLEILGNALGGLAIIYTFGGEFNAGLRYWDRARDLAERQGSPPDVATTILSRALTTFWMGNWNQARREFERAVALRGQTNVSVYDSLGPLCLGCLSLAEGEWEEAGNCLEECVDVAERHGDLLMLRWAQGLLAERDLLLGRPDAARTRLVPLLDRPGLEEFFVSRFLPVLAWAHLELGEMADAEQVTDQAIRRLRADHNRLDLVDALRTQAMVMTRQKRCAEAEHSLEEGLALARNMPYPYAEARLLHVYGEMHEAKGEPEPARERLETALAIFQRLGARKDAERIERVIADLQQP